MRRVGVSQLDTKGSEQSMSLKVELEKFNKFLFDSYY